MHIRIALASLVCCAGLQAQISVVNAASFRQQPGVATGSFASAFGSFAGATTTAAAALPFPTSLGGVTVTVGGTAAPLQYVSSTQINFLVPAAVTPGLRPIVVTSGSATLNGNVRVVTAAPGLSTQDTATPPKGAIQNQDASLNTSANPARRGQLVQLFGTGPGAFSAPVADGTASPTSPLVTTTSAPQVYIGGVPATVQFSGLTPGAVGLWQINATVPDRPFLSGRVPVQVFVDGVDSNEVTLFVAQ